jgi:hypothetical protein
MKKIILKKERPKITPFVGTQEEFIEYLLKSENENIRLAVLKEKEKSYSEIVCLLHNLKV